MTNEAHDLYTRALEEATRGAPDFAVATALLKEAVDKGSLDATYALATWYLFGKEPYINRDVKEGVRLLTRAADGGVREAMYDLAVSFEKGVGIERNEQCAFDYYLRAAIRGDAQSIFEVGRCIFWGIGVSKDHRLARIWFDRAKELGTYEADAEG